VGERRRDALRLIPRQPRVHVHGRGPEVGATGQAAQHRDLRQHRMSRIFQATRFVVQRQSAERVRLRMAIEQQRRHQRITSRRGIYREARGIDQVAAGVRDGAVGAAQARVELQIRRVVAAVHIACPHVQLPALEQRLKLQGIAHREGGAARHPQGPPLRLETAAFRRGHQMPDLIDRRVGGGSHGLPGSGR